MAAVLRLIDKDKAGPCEGRDRRAVKSDQVITSLTTCGEENP